MVPVQFKKTKYTLFSEAPNKAETQNRMLKAFSYNFLSLRSRKCQMSKIQRDVGKQGEII